MILETTRLGKQLMHVFESPLYLRIAKGVFWSLIGAAIYRSLSFASAVLTARLLGPDNYGKYGVIQNTIGMFGVFAGAGIGISITKFVAEFRNTDEQKTTEYIFLSLIVTAISGIIVSLILLMISPTLAESVFKLPEIVDEVRFSTLLVFLSALNGAQIGILQGFEKFSVTAKLATAKGISSAAFVLTGAYFWGLRGAVIGMILPEIIALSIYQVALRKECKPFLKFSIRVSGNRALELIKFAIPALLSSIVFLPAFWVSNIILINQPSGYSYLGVYNAAEKWRQLILFLPASITPIVLPILSNLNGTRNKFGFIKVFNTNLFLNIGLVVIPIFGLIIFAKQAMLLFGSEFSGGNITLIILSLSVIGTILNTVLGQVLVSKGMIWKRFFFDALLALLLVGFAFLLIPFYKHIGLALSLLGSYSITSFLIYMHNKKLYIV